MKLATIIVISLLCCNVATSQAQLNFTHEEIVKQVLELVKQQKVELDTATQKLAETQTNVSNLQIELAAAQTAITKVGQERDKWKQVAQTNAIKLATARKHVAYLVTALTLLTVAIGGYFFLKLYMKVPIPF